MTSGLPDPAFWRGKRVFMTGHTGFKGSWLALWLDRLGARVTGFALAPEGQTLCDMADVERRVRSVRGDIRDLAALQAAMREADPQIVLHLAAQAIVRQSYHKPVETFATNVLGTAHVLEAGRSAENLRAIVVVTTDKCYENHEWPWAYRETDPLGGHDPYSASKACAEIVTQSWRRSFFTTAQAGEMFTGLATARAGNVIGGGDWSVDRLIPDCIRAFSHGERVAIRNPASTRPWQHVLDPLCGYLLLAEKLCIDGAASARAFNFGPAIEDARAVTIVVEALARAWGYGAAWYLAAGTHPHEAGFLAVDPALSRWHLGWRPRLKLLTAVDWTGRWYREHQRGADAAKLVEADIQEFERVEIEP